MQIGSRIHDYEIIRQIGSGGMGEVWLAHETMLDREVAIKLLNHQLTRDAEFALRFQNEARIQARLKHPNIVGLLAFFEEGGDFYMVLEYAPGITLRELIDRTGPIPEQRTLRIFNQIAAALEYAHSKGIIHRDVKPSNIMVDPDNSDHVLMMDFGIARLLTDGHLTRTGTRLGTMHYMSPEQVQAADDIDQRSDVYSAGVVLYEMLSGRLPFNADTDSEYAIQHKIVTEEIPDPRKVYPNISDTTVSLVRWLTVKDRDKRPKNIYEVVVGEGAESDTNEELNDLSPRQHFSETKSTSSPDVIHSKLQDESKHPTMWTKYWYVFLVFIGLLAFLGVLIFHNKQGIPNVAASSDSTEAITDSIVDARDNDKAMADVYIPVEFIRVAGGTFMMGFDDGSADEKPAHQVTVSSFWIGKYEVTQKEWTEVMGSNPSFKKGDDLPVINVAWFDAVDYCIKRSLKEGLQLCYTYNGDSVTCDWNANGYRLPTEAEWEFAARGGTKSNGYRYSGSNELGAVAWYEDNSGKKSHKVGTKTPNELGIYDMSGNVWTWCWDLYDSVYYGISSGSNPRGPKTGKNRVLRGGSWGNPSGFCQVNKRFSGIPDYRKYYGTGFRVVRSSGQ